jgi:hypothetical protein
MGLLNPWWDWCSRMFKNQMQFSGLLLLFAFELLSQDGSTMHHFPLKSFIILQNSLIFFTHHVDENYL